MAIDVHGEIEAVFNEMTAGSSQESTETPQTTETTPQAASSDDKTQSTAQATTEQKAVTEDTGPIPLDRHKSILEKARQEYDGKLSKLSWAEKYEATDVEGKLKLIKELDETPDLFYDRLGNALKSDQRYAQRFVTKDTKVEEKPDPRPTPDKVLESGDLFYSVEQQQKLLDWQERQITKKFEERYGSIREEHENKTAFNQELNKQRAKLDEARTWDGFKENEVEIAKLLASDSRVTLASAYARVVPTKLKADKEQLEKDIRTRLIAEMNKKGGSITGEKPATVVQAQEKNFKGMTTEEILRETHRELSDRK